MTHDKVSVFREIASQKVKDGDLYKKVKEAMLVEARKGKFRLEIGSHEIDNNTRKVLKNEGFNLSYTNGMLNTVISWD